MDLPDPLPPVLERSLKILEPMFVEKVLPAPENGGHGLLATPTQWNPLLDSIPSAARAVGDNLRKKWEAPDCRSSPAEKWAELSSHLKFYIKEKLAPVSKNKLAKMTDTAERRRLTNWCAATIFQHTYPRLDINVSKMRNHLLKSPFCVHPKTGRVCVPIVVTRTTSPLVATKVDFDPFSVPTLPILLQELDQYRQDHPEDEDNDNNGTGAAAVMRDWEKTSLKKYYDPYIRDFLEPLQKSIFRANREVMEQQAALATDF